jgi:hypothetical protein
MRATIHLENALGHALQIAAQQRGESLSAFLAEAGRRYLAEPTNLPATPFQLITRGGNGVQSGVDLNQINNLTAMDDIRSFARNP